MSESITLPAALGEDLYSGLLTCRDTVKLLGLFALNVTSDNDDYDLLLAPLELLEDRLSALALLVDPGVLRKQTKAQEVNHAC